MANGFDRLERFFAKKKPQTTADSGEPVATATAAAPFVEPQFPSPSFIRPKTTRMAAREEVRVGRPGSRIPSLPEPASPRQILDSVNTQSTNYVSDLFESQYSPITTSFTQHEADLFLDGFDGFQFPRPPTYIGEHSPVSSTAKSSIESERRPRSRTSRPTHASADRFDTPPSSDLEDEDRGPQYFRSKKLPEIPQRQLPTPGPSPERLCVFDLALKESKSIDFLNKAVYKDLRRQLDETLEKPQFQRSSSQSSPAPSFARLSISSSTLREPNFKEFLSLSDDDIAETSPVDTTPEQSTSAAPSTTHSTDSPSQSYLTLTPPFASRPATAAAFEAARIANRYNFDLVYVVNLWPENGCPRTSGVDKGDSVSVNSDWSTRSGMTGRLLAAYGLENVSSPFQISAEVHGQVLRSNGWIEYRKQHACDDEFALGYATSFYTGQYSRSGQPSPRNSSSTGKSDKTDRGIVFAAYRKPRVDGSQAEVGSNPDELGNIYRDAEALVEMLIDIHVANRLRQPQPHSSDSDETGPMPEQRFIY